MNDDHRWPRRLLPLAALVVLLVAPPMAASQCETVRPNSSPSWALTGGWNDVEPTELLLLDSSQGSLVRFEKDGRRVTRPHRGHVAEAVSQLRPLEAWPLPGGGLVIEGEGMKLARVEFGRRNPGPPVDVAKQAGLLKVFPFRWGLSDNSLASGGLVLCGQYQSSAGTEGWSPPGFYYLPLEGDRTPVQLMDFDARGQVDGYVTLLGCRHGGQVVASVNGTAYVLVFDLNPTIRRVDPTAEDPFPALVLDEVPEPMRLRPVLPNLVLRSNYASFMAEIERASMPVELIGWGGHLYVLLRQPAEVAVTGTQWSLAQITLGEGNTGKVKVAQLKSHASHLSIIPGPERWAFVEKASPEALGKQEILGFHLIPTSLIEKMEDKQPLCP